MVTPTSDLSVAGAHLHVAVVAVRGAAVPDHVSVHIMTISLHSPHAISLGPVVTVVTVAAPGARVSLRVRGGAGVTLTPGLQGPVLLPGVHPVPDM